MTKSVLTVLKARGIAVTDQRRMRIVSCLKTWIRRAATITTADQL